MVFQLVLMGPSPGAVLPAPQSLWPATPPTHPIATLRGLPFAGTVSEMRGQPCCGAALRDGCVDAR